MSKAAVLIPLYKKELSKYERISILQCFKVLGKYDIYFFSYTEFLDSFDFASLLPEGCKYHTACFDAHYFSSFQGYNQLLLSENFYRHFSDYTYILIYQPDAFVFYDQLSVWCSKGYDYVGAPWFRKRKGSSEAELWAVGNGGFSLRNVQSHIDLLNSEERFYRKRELIRLLLLDPFSRKNLKYCLPRIFGFKNKIRQYISAATHNEDGVIGEAGIRSKAFKLAPVHEAVAFSFDHHPDKLYRLNGNQLPFGCHAWYRDDDGYKGNLEFWKTFIS